MGHHSRNCLVPRGWDSLRKRNHQSKGAADPQFRKRYKPADVDDGLWAKVARTLRTRTSDGRYSSSSQIPAAPSQVDIHATALDRFVGQEKHKDSSLRRKVLEWRFSEAGKAWQQQRESILGKDACEDDSNIKSNFNSNIDSDINSNINSNTNNKINNNINNMTF